MIEELCALVEGKEWDKAWFLTIGLTMDIPELEVKIGRVGWGETKALRSYYIG